MTKGLIWLLVLAVAGLPGIGLALDSGSGVIQGQVVNGTDGGGIPANQGVTLEVYVNDVKQEDSPTGVADAEGKFQFPGLAADSEHSYSVLVTYQGAEYYSERIVFNPGETATSVEVKVFEATESADAISVPSAHTIVYVADGELLVKEYLLLGNGSDRTYVGPGTIGPDGKRETLRYPLARGATGLQPTLGLMECCVIGGDDSLIDTMPLLPGMREVGYSYTVKPGSGDYLLARRIDYPTGALSFLVERQEGVEVASGQLVMEEPLEIQGTQFIYLTGNGLPRGNTVEINLSGLAGRSGLGVVSWVLIVLAVCAGALAITLLLRRRAPQAVPSGAAVDSASLEGRRRELIRELANLDDDFAAGGIPEDVYQGRRAETKAQLMVVMRQLGARS